MSDLQLTEDISKNVEEISDKHYLEVRETTETRPKPSKKDLLKFGLKLLSALLVWAHFGWATYYFIEHTNLTVEETTCSGYGFLIIIFCIINFGITYKYLLKPFAIPKFKKFIWTPTANLLSKIRYGSYIFYILALAAALVYLIIDTKNDRTRLIPISGLCFYVSVAFLICPYKKQIPWHTVIWGLILQFVFGLLTIRWATGRNIFECIGNKVTTFLDYAVKGSAFVYSDELVIQKGVFAFNALATIYFMGFMVNILYYYGIMQSVVGNIGRFLQWVMGTSICESVNSASNIFLGQSEAPLVLKPYLHYLTDSEIHSLLTAGFATVSGSVLAGYISFGADAAHLITSSVMSAPAALCMSKIIYPETEKIVATREKIKTTQVEFESALDAASKGAQDASHMVIAIIANLIAFVALVHFVNGVLSFYGEVLGFVDESEKWTVELIVGKIFIPISWLMGVPWDECELVGQLIGIKTLVNEFVAFERMGKMHLTEKSKLIATYSICGFANPGSIGMMISTLGTLIPSKREAIIRLVFRAFLGGCFTCFMTACIAAMLIPENELVNVP